MKSLEIVNREIANLDEDDLWTNGELNIIKQDLEVLEIIKNNFKYWVDLISGTPYLEGHCEIEKEDREKVKQWLEDNE